MRWGHSNFDTATLAIEREDYSFDFINFFYMVLTTHAMHESENKRLKQINCHLTTQNNVQINAQSKVFYEGPNETIFCFIIFQRCVY